MGQTPSMTPSATPGHATPLLTPGGSTPIGHKAMLMATPAPGAMAAMTPEQLQAYRWEKEIDERNRPFTDEELDAMFPPGYKVNISSSNIPFEYLFYHHLNLINNNNNDLLYN